MSVNLPSFICATKIFQGIKLFLNGLLAEKNFAWFVARMKIEGVIYEKQRLCLRTSYQRGGEKKEHLIVRELGWPSRKCCNEEAGHGQLVPSESVLAPAEEKVADREMRRHVDAVGGLNLRVFPQPAQNAKRVQVAGPSKDHA